MKLATTSTTTIRNSLIQLVFVHMAYAAYTVAVQYDALSVDPALKQL
jgi:hypothetical protein